MGEARLPEKPGRPGRATQPWSGLHTRSAMDSTGVHPYWPASSPNGKHFTGAEPGATQSIRRGVVHEPASAAGVYERRRGAGSGRGPGFLGPGDRVELFVKEGL